MKKQEVNVKAVVLAVLGAAAVLFGFAHFLVMPLLAYNQEINELTGKVSAKQLELMKNLREKQQVERWKALSLPTDPNLAEREYDKYLSDLMTRCEIDVQTKRSKVRLAEARGGPGGAKKLPYTPVEFNITAKAPLEAVVKMLGLLQTTPLDQKVRDLTLTPLDDKKPGGPLLMTLIVEALIHDNANVQPNLVGPDERLVELEVLFGLRRAPAGLALLPWRYGPRGPYSRTPLPLAGPTPPRKYDLIVRRNVFVGGKWDDGPKGPDSTLERLPELVQLTMISKSALGTRAELFDKLHETTQTLRKGDKFTLSHKQDASGTGQDVRATVELINDSAMYFRAGEKLYAIQCGETLAKAMSRPVEASQAEQLGLVKSTNYR
jgi:hypothetical protein